MLPNVWYFSSKPGQIFRKNSYNITKENIEGKFLIKYTTSEIIGTEYSFSSDNKCKVSIHTQYILKDELQKYISSSTNKNDKIFQGFVHPQRNYNSNVLYK